MKKWRGRVAKAPRIKEYAVAEDKPRLTLEDIATQLKAHLGQKERAHPERMNEDRAAGRPAPRKGHPDEVLSKATLEDFDRWDKEGPWLGGTDLIVESGRCTGHCCRSFNLPLTPKDVAQFNKALDAGKRPSDADWGLRGYTDIDIIAPMLIHHGDMMRSPAGDFFRERPHDRSNWYGCKHHCAVSGNCTIYDKRPQMCRDHPYQRECGYAACTLKVEREWYWYVGPPLPPEMQAELDESRRKVSVDICPSNYAKKSAAKVGGYDKAMAEEADIGEYVKGC